jgi:hypothetical protein
VQLVPGYALVFQQMGNAIADRVNEPAVIRDERFLKRCADRLAAVTADAAAGNRRIEPIKPIGIEQLQREVRNGAADYVE